MPPKSRPRRAVRPCRGVPAPPTRTVHNLVVAARHPAALASLLFLAVFHNMHTVVGVLEVQWTRIYALVRAGLAYAPLLSIIGPTCQGSRGDKHLYRKWRRLCVRRGAVSLAQAYAYTLEHGAHEAGDQFAIGPPPPLIEAEAEPPSTALKQEAVAPAFPAVALRVAEPEAAPMTDITGHALLFPYTGDDTSFVGVLFPPPALSAGGRSEWRASSPCSYDECALINVRGAGYARCYGL